MDTYIYNLLKLRTSSLFVGGVRNARIVYAFTETPFTEQFFYKGTLNLKTVASAQRKSMADMPRQSTPADCRGGTIDVDITIYIKLGGSRHVRCYEFVDVRFHLTYLRNSVIIYRPPEFFAPIRYVCYEDRGLSLVISPPNVNFVRGTVRELSTKLAFVFRYLSVCPDVWSNILVSSLPTSQYELRRCLRSSYIPHNNA